MAYAHLYLKMKSNINNDSKTCLAHTIDLLWLIRYDRSLVCSKCNARMPEMKQTFIYLAFQGLRAQLSQTWWPKRTFGYTRSSDGNPRIS